MKHEIYEVYNEPPIQKVLDTLQKKLGKELKMTVKGNRVSLSWGKKSKVKACRFCSRWGSAPRICEGCFKGLYGPSEFRPIDKDPQVTVNLLLLDIDDGVEK
jgi:hypothetical protein